MTRYDRISLSLGRGLIKTGLVAAGSVLAFLIAELGLRLFWHPHLASWQGNLNLTVPIDPEVVTGVAGPARIKTTCTGVRGAEWSEDRSREYRILALGGSTTMCLDQDQPNTWTAQLQTLLPEMPDGRKVWVGNAGAGGHHSRHHVLAMRQMLDVYDPDAVVILLGANDRGVLLSEGHYYDAGFIDNDAKMRELARDFAQQPLSLLTSQGRLSPRATLLWVLFRNVRHRLFEASERGFVHNGDLYRDRRELRQRPWLVVDEMPVDLGPGLDGYRHNLLACIHMARARGVRLVFMTQPELYKPNMPAEEVARLWTLKSALISINGYWSPRVMAAVLDEHNGVLRETCAAEGIACVDLAARIPSTLEYFWDQHHFTDLGSRLVAEALAGLFGGQAAGEPGASQSDTVQAGSRGDVLCDNRP